MCDSDCVIVSKKKWFDSNNLYRTLYYIWEGKYGWAIVGQGKFNNLDLVHKYKTEAHAKKALSLRRSKPSPLDQNARICVWEDIWDKDVGLDLEAF
jgi:hypothetical protein